jgi:hypothetical protein
VQQCKMFYKHRKVRHIMHHNDSVNSFNYVTFQGRWSLKTRRKQGNRTHSGSFRGTKLFFVKGRKDSNMSFYETTDPLSNE